MLREVDPAADERVSLEARQDSLLKLIGELLQRNEELRQKIARLEAENAGSAHTSA
jgi:uncharacterized small protein (DUF1192 family)